MITVQALVVLIDPISIVPAKAKQPTKGEQLEIHILTQGPVIARQFSSLCRKAQCYWKIEARTSTVSGEGVRVKQEQT